MPVTVSLSKVVGKKDVSAAMAIPRASFPGTIQFTSIHE
jgi:hypothetical protein